MISFLQGGLGAVNACLFEGFVGGAPTGGVADLDGPAIQGQAGGDNIAGGAWFLGDDAARVACQGVDQAAFADVGWTGDNYLPGVNKVFAQGDTLDQFFEDRLSLFQVIGLKVSG
jgi:hypothetical protein